MKNARHQYDPNEPRLRETQNYKTWDDLGQPF